MEGKISLSSRFYAWLCEAWYGSPKNQNTFRWGPKMRDKVSSLELYGRPQDRKDANPEAYSPIRLENSAQMAENYLKSHARMHFMLSGGKSATIFAIAILCGVMPLTDAVFQKAGQAIAQIKQAKAEQVAQEDATKQEQAEAHKQMVEAVARGQGPQLLKNMVANKNNIINNVKMGITNQQAAEKQLADLKEQYSQIKTLCNCEPAN